MHIIIIPAVLILNIFAKIKPSGVFKRKSGTLKKAMMQESENKIFLDKMAIKNPPDRIIGIHTREEINNEIDNPYALPKSSRPLMDNTELITARLILSKP